MGLHYGTPLRAGGDVRHSVITPILVTYIGITLKLKPLMEQIWSRGRGRE